MLKCCILGHTMPMMPTASPNIIDPTTMKPVRMSRPTLLLKIGLKNSTMTLSSYLAEYRFPDDVVEGNRILVVEIPQNEPGEG